MKMNVLAAILAVFSVLVPVTAADIELSPEQVHEEVDFIVQSVKEIHPRPFEMVSETAFLAHAEAIKASAGTVSYKESLREMIRLIAMLEDGHSVLWPFRIADGSIELFPMRSYIFSDGWYILSTRLGDKLFAGGRIVTIGDKPVEEAAALMMAYCSGDNDWSRKENLPQYLNVKAFVELLGLLDSEGRLALEVLCTDGVQRRLTLRAVDDPFSSGVFNTREKLPGGLDGFVYRSAENTVKWPHVPHAGENYWFIYIEKADTLYMQFNSVRHEEERFGPFINRMFTIWDEQQPRQLLIDLRNNGGGNNTILQPLIHGLIKRDEFQASGKLIILTGRKTFSAAMCCAGWISRNVATVFAGEPTGARPNHPGDSANLKLPHSGYFLRISKYYWTNTQPWDQRQAIYPAIPHEVSSEEYFAGKDVLLDTLLNGEPYRTLTDTLVAALRNSQGSVAAMRSAYHDYKERYPDTWTTTESELNSFGYTLLNEGLEDLALAVFELNVESYPQAYNTWDSLAEIWMKKGDKEQALKFYRKSLELNPDNENAIKMISELQQD